LIESAWQYVTSIISVWLQMSKIAKVLHLTRVME